MTAILVAVVIVAALALAMRSERSGLIAEHSYNNRYNDAPGARDDHLG